MFKIKEKMQTIMLTRKEYRKKEYYKASIKLLDKFVDIILDGDIDKLMTYCFDDLKEISVFTTSGTQEAFDCDNLIITKAIYCILWGHIFDIKEGDIGNWNSSTEMCIFRGDTINSFNTLFGGDRYGQFGYRARNRGLDTDFYIWKGITSFYREYHTIGNFILLPNIGNVNGKRVYKNVGDYFDLFLIDVDKYKRKEDMHNAKLKEVLEKNDFYSREECFKILKEEMFLNDYFDDKFNPRYVFGNVTRSYRYFENNHNEYKKFVKNYIRRSEKIISKRSKKMIKILKSELKIFKSELKI